MSRPRSAAPGGLPALALLVALSTGCYAYVPSRGALGALTGHPVEVPLTDSGAVVMASAVGPATDALRGTLVGDSAGSYLLAVRGVRRRSGDESEWGGERIAVPHVLTTGLRERRLSPVRSALVSIGAVGVLLGARAAFSGAGGSNAGKSETPPSGGAK